jgi:hypothetical protein
MCGIKATTEYGASPLCSFHYGIVSKPRIENQFIETVKLTANEVRQLESKIENLRQEIIRLESVIKFNDSFPPNKTKFIHYPFNSEKSEYL